ncbi:MULTISPECIES: hypothetical protein [unclassified Bradyrhizobium]|uniref:hypothetical protein n=1 Tax=unclassified Bradyrhizobium TaxID=2631580 RepID=UPI00247A0F59|nr:MULTISPECIES: hypothetical protein [unclassified Bradyrhizobium]WGR75132.1 hypothetical protein MTX24_20315 [Bradyrhizobium sp. ISRA426]WGR82636.1 hypothetical protein MTX21_05430 [Bradyrhizobium sp. ISRA430]WGR90332.1 hypothetical protein MTX25_19995 [Bradyrhizobium sp. ISRA432]
MNSSNRSVLMLVVLAAALVPVSKRYVGPAYADATADLLATQIRSQGLVCDKPQKATRDAKLSKRDYDVWVVKCENATYRYGRYPDLPANIEKLSDENADKK